MTDGFSGGDHVRDLYCVLECSMVISGIVFSKEDKVKKRAILSY